MLEKAKSIVNVIKTDVERKKEEKEQLKKQQKELAEKQEQERMEMEIQREAERLAKEEAEIQAEKENLMSLSEKELLVEIVMALRGLYSRIEELEVAHEELDDEVWNLKKEVKDVKTEAVRKDLELATMRLQKH